MEKIRHEFHELTRIFCVSFVGIRGIRGKKALECLSTLKRDTIEKRKGLYVSLKLTTRASVRFTIYVLLFLSACTPFRVTRPVFKIGLVAPFEGTYRHLGYDAIYAARLAVREINQAGGAWGYTVELVAYDDGGTVEGARRAARNLALDPDVVAVLGHFRQPTTLAALDVYAEAGLPFVAISAGRRDSQDGDPPLLFWGAADQALAQALCAHLAATWPDHRWALLSDALHASLAQALRRAAAQYQIELGVDGVVTEPADLVHFSSQTDGLLLALEPRTAGEVVLAWRQAGWEGVVAGGPSLGSPLFVTVAGEGAWGAVLATPYRWPDDPAFISAYRGVGPHTPAPGPFALATYESFTGLVTVVGQVDGRLTRERLGEVLQSDRLTPPGLIFVYRLTESGMLEQAVFP